MKQLMLGNAAVARGLYEAGCAVVSSYPGTPSTEITEEAAKYDEIYCEWAPNEKVAMEVAFGAALAGKRSFCGMKHVGLNVAADPLFTVSYTGINAGMVIAVADDPGMHSSQNEQDSRHYAIGAKIPMLEPADSKEALEFTKRAYEISEEFDTPVLLKMCTRVAHSQSIVNIGERAGTPKKPYEKNIAKYVMMPGNAKGRHVFVEQRENKLIEDGCDFPINKVEWNDKKIGVITSGIPYQYVKEALPQASVLKLGIVYPLPKKLIEQFASEVETLYVVEELEPMIEEQVKSWGISVIGKEIFTVQGEYSANLLRTAVLGQDLQLKAPAQVPGRPPILCPGCPHRSVYSVLNKLKIHAAGDIGCYTLGAVAPLSVVDTTICMGASISSLHGMEKAKGKDYIKNWVAVIGDSTFLHTGINSLMNMVYNQSTGTVIILDNSTTGMTGHQDHAATGKTLQGDPTWAIDIPGVCRAMGIKNVIEVNAFALKELEQVIKEEVAKDEISVIITKSPCVLLDKKRVYTPYVCDSEKCKKCGMCMKPGCPAMTKKPDGTILIDDTMCTGCGLCEQLCKFGAIRKAGE